MTARNPHNKKSCAVTDRAYNCLDALCACIPLSKLFQKPEIVLVIHLNIRDAVLQHVVALNAQAECKAGIFLRVVMDKREYTGIHHSGSHHLDPTRLLAYPASGSIAKNARQL